MNNFNFVFIIVTKVYAWILIAISSFPFFILHFSYLSGQKVTGMNWPKVCFPMRRECLSLVSTFWTCLQYSSSYILYNTFWISFNFYIFHNSYPFILFTSGQLYSSFFLPFLPSFLPSLLISLSPSLILSLNIFFFPSFFPWLFGSSFPLLFYDFILSFLDKF